MSNSQTYSKSVEKKLAVPLVKTDRNAFSSMITIGRAKNNDVILRSSKISKLHAVLQLPAKNEGFMLMDMESTNGTFHNGIRLQPRVPVSVKNGDRIGLWRFVFEFHLPESIVELLEKDK